MDGSPGGRQRRSRPGRRNALLALAAVTAAGLGIDACASAGSVRLDTLAPLGPPTVWPSPPDPPRVRLVTGFSSATDLGFRRSFLGRVVDFVRGRSAFSSIQHPYGIAVTDDERIYVVDSAAKGVHFFDLPEGRYRFLGGNGFENPIGVAVAPNDEIWVTDSEGAFVSVLDEDGDEVRRIHQGLVRPTGVAFSPVDSAVYVVDTGAHEVRVFDTSGEPVGAFGGRGTEAGRYNYPTNIAVDEGGLLYISDSMNFRIQKVRPDGTPVDAFGSLGDAVGEFARPKGVGVDPTGRVFVVEGLYDVVNIFDQGGRLLLSFGGAGREHGTFWLATGLAVDVHGRLFVADTYNGRIQVFQLLDRGMP